MDITNRTGADLIEPEVNPLSTPETNIASTIIPYERDDERAMYLGYRASGFSVRESLHMVQRSKAWLSGCRHDERFVELELSIPEYRKELSNEYMGLEYVRNFRLFMEKDKRVITKSLSTDPNVLMTKNEQDYLIKARGMYTPTQLQILEAIISGGKSEDFDWLAALHDADVVQVKRTDSITVARNAEV